MPRPHYPRSATLGTGGVWSNVERPIPHFGTDVPYSNKLSNSPKEQKVSVSSPAGAVVGKGEPDPVNHPSHYGGADDPFEAIKVIRAWGAGFAVGNALKYLARAGKKDPSRHIEDLRKAIFYLEDEVRALEAAA